MPSGKRFFLRTFGCKSNQYESQAMREALIAAGLGEASRVEEADLYILNTCAVTGRAAASCRRAVRQAARANPGIRLVAVGCGVDLGERWPETPAGPPLQIANARKPQLARLILAWLGGKGEGGGEPEGRVSSGEDGGLSVSGFADHSRAFLKIQDGCDNACAYCAVPLARGEPFSRPAGGIFAEA
ncbi:MAG: tRNA (N6-isopentenyl adenosine(37)-C2)-methylthiotransferase MiaB, partial [Planctomycetota bacterium]|nr:tRNA (N6-isopentenyl adenosine(37)-C2)-methylthiotransferase MiaB [Planctomycetota bacterium]